MTNAEPATPDEYARRIERRADEPYVLAELPKTFPKWTGPATILRVGEFRPGDRSAYAAVRVLVAWTYPGEDRVQYTTHTAVFADDRPDHVRWQLYMGRPFEDYEQAAADLALGYSR